MPEAATKDDIDAVNRRLDDLINIGRVGLNRFATLPVASSIRKRVLLTNESSAPSSTSQFDLVINNVG